MTLDHWLAHVRHVARLVGPEHVGIGTDWGIEMPRALALLLNEEMKRSFGFREEHGVDWTAVVDGFESWTCWPNLTRALVAAMPDGKFFVSALGENNANGIDAGTIYIYEPGDTGGGGENTAPAAGDWRWLYVDGGQLQLDHALLAYGAGLLAVSSGFGDGTYTVEGLYRGGELLALEVEFIGPQQEHLLEQFPVLRY